MYNLAELTLADMARATTRLRKVGTDATSFSQAADRVVRYLYEEFGDPTQKLGGSVLVRLYKTLRFAGLSPSLQQFARRTDPDAHDRTRCLVLIASVGDEPDWCSPETSRGHRAIPLSSIEAVGRLPMVAQLLMQLGIDVGAIVSPDRRFIVDHEEHKFNVFHVAEAANSPHIPAQDFVRGYKVASVLGFGGQLPDDEIYSVILFSRLLITRDTAETFKPLAVAAKLALVPFVDLPLFDTEGTS